MKKNTGFTFIELLVSMTVIAILITLGFGAIREVQIRSRDTNRISDLKSVQVGLELYFNKCGRYPGDATCGSTNPTGWAGLTTSLGAVMQTSKVPQPRVASKLYFYGVDSEGLGYVVGAQLESDDNSVLLNDVDGTVYTVDCGSATGDTIYCIQS